MGNSVLAVSYTHLDVYKRQPWNHVLFGGVTTAAQDTLTIAERVVERLSERIDVVTTTVGEAAKLAPKRIEIPGHIEHRASTSR